MKTLNKMLILVMIFMALAAITQADEVGNGGDTVELVYIEAAAQVRNKLNPLQDNMVFVLRIDPDVKDWLLEKVETRSRLGHLKRLARFLERDTMQFVDGPCIEPSGALRPITYIGDEYAPRVCISRSLNQTTTVEQATALLLHELGHGTGEKDHIFLSDFGRQMASNEASAGIRMREDGKQVIVELTKAQVNPGGYPISIWNNLHSACQIYGYDGGIEFSRLNTSNVVHEVKAWSINSTKGVCYFDGIETRWTVTDKQVYSRIVCYKNL